MSIRAIGRENIVVVLPTRRESVIKVGGVELLLVGAGDFDVRSYNSEEDFLRIEDEQFEALSTHDSSIERNEGVVVSIPCCLTYNSFGEKYGNRVDIEVGDYVYFHHNVTSEQFSLGYEGMYWSKYEMFFARKGIDGVLYTIGDNCLTVAVKEEKDNIITNSGIWLKSGVGNKFLMATVTHFGNPREGNERRWWNWMLHKEEIIGKTIIYSENSDIRLTIEGVEYFRMKVEDIVGIVGIDNSLELQNKYVLLEQKKSVSEVNGVIIPDSLQKKEDNGIVYAVGLGGIEKGINIEDEVWYYPSGATNFEWCGKVYILIDADYIYMKSIK